MTETSTSGERRAIAYATLPPPVNGLAVATQYFISKTSSSVNWQIESVGRNSERTIYAQFDRLGRNVAATLRCLQVRHHKVSSCYMPVSAGWTIGYNIGFAAACRLRNIPLLAHHHSYSYINRKSRRMTMLNAMMGRKDAYVFLSDSMRAAFDKKYRRKAQAITLPNAFALPDLRNVPDTAAPKDSCVRIGHLSNLSIEKGLGTIVETFAELNTQGCNCELHLAGPISGRREKEILDRACRQFGNAVVLYGPVDDAEKARFFSNIDYFWFPSDYRNEAQPIVLVEALASGIPCFCINRGCIDWVIGNAGTVAADRKQFARSAIAAATKSRSAEDLLFDRDQCLKQFSKLQAAAVIGLSEATDFLNQGNS